MSFIGTCIIYLIIFSLFLGGVASICNEESPLAKEFSNGLGAIGIIFVPVAGVMASFPYLTSFISSYVTPIFNTIGADPSIAATSFIAVDMGGYHLAKELAKTNESWMLSMVVGCMAGASLVFTIPVALKFLKKEDHQYFAMGSLAGFIAIPFALMVAALIMQFSLVMIRPEISTQTSELIKLSFSWKQIVMDLTPVTVVCFLIALALYFIPKIIVQMFMYYGYFLEALLKLIFIFSAVEYFTGFFSSVLGGWGFDPIIADAKDFNRALEVAGYIGIMLAGAFPLMYLLQKYLRVPLEFVSRKLGLSSLALTGLLAASANVLALFVLIPRMTPEDKIKTVAFAVCSAFLVGDHLAFAANYQPSMIPIIIFSKFIGGVFAIAISHYFVIPHILKKRS